MRPWRAVMAVGILAWATGAPAQDWRGGTGRLEGTVKDPDGKPIADAVVKLDLPGRGGTQLKTDKKGHWAILGLESGSWSIDVEATGFASRRVSARVMQAEGGRTPSVDLKLQRDSAKGPPPELLKAAQKGDEAYKAEHYAEARAEYEKVLALRPELAETLHFQIARCYKMEKDTPKELEHLQAVVDANPANNEAKALMAMEALEGGMFDRAVELFKKVDETTIKSPDVFFNVGVSFRNKDKPEEAILYFTKAIALDPNYVDGYFQRGLTYFSLQKLAEAKADFKKVVELNPEGDQAKTAKRALEQVH